jgi:hypothetical protein
MIAAARLLRSPALLAMAAIGLLLLLAGTFSVVPETKQAVVLRLGAPMRVVNRYRPDEVFGRTGAGLIARISMSSGRRSHRATSCVSSSTPMPATAWPIRCACI